MRIRVGNKVLTIPEAKRSSLINNLTPQVQFISNHWYDIVKEVKAINYCCGYMQNINSIIDVMAGCGFSASVFTYHYPLALLKLNDLSEDCYRILKNNFPKSNCYNMDANKVIQKPVDMAFVDFNNFTLKHIEKWEELWKRIRKFVNKYLMLTDSACYGFKFGNLNKCYQLVSKEAYYELLGKQLYKKIHMHLNIVVSFGNAAVLVFSHTKLEKIHYGVGKDLLIIRGGLLC